MILSVDQGTSGTLALITDKNGAVVSKAYVPHPQIYPQLGWVSHDAALIYTNVLKTCRVAMDKAKLNLFDIDAMGITNQRETLVVWDAETGEPVDGAIVWQCRRSADICKRIVSDGFEDTLRQKTGLVADPYFTATKLKWMLDNHDLSGLIQNGRLRAGTMDCFLLWKLTNGKVFATDYGNASRTMLLNIHSLDWDNEILDYFGIPRQILPGLVPSSGIAGMTNEPLLGDAFVPISGIAGDQHAALFGQLCYHKGDAKNTFGTGCFILQNIGDKPVIPKSRLLTTVAWNIDGQTTYALEGGVFCAGAAIDWMVNKLGLANHLDELSEICDEIPDTKEVYFVPALQGLGAPYWDMDARGIFCGMSLASDRRHLIRAVLESLSYRSRDVLSVMEKETGISLSSLKVDGGVSKNGFGMQFLADMLGVAVSRPAITETTALGAAYLAGLGVGYYESTDKLAANFVIEKEYKPQMEPDRANSLYDGWMKAVEKARA